MRRHRPRRPTCRPSIEPVEPRVLLATFAVRNTADSGVGTLRQAMLDANASPGADLISFQIPASTAPLLDVPVAGFDPFLQLWTITLASPLPVITDTLTLDGLSQAQAGVPYRYPDQVTPTVTTPVFIDSSPNTQSSLEGNDAHLRLVLDGHLIDRAAYPDPAGLVVTASHSNIRGLVIDGFDDAVVIPAGGVLGVRVQGNSLGGYFVFAVDLKSGQSLEGSGGIGFLGRGNTGNGITVGSTNAAIGGANEQDANIIVDSGERGVWIQPGAEGSVVQGNQIGVAGPALNIYAQRGNALEGILVESSSNAIGGPVAGAGNVVSANGGDGIRFTGVATTRNHVDGNYIGAAPGGGYRFGSGEPGNGGDGIRFEDAPNNRVGGAQPEQRNVISANQGAGVRLTGSSTVSNLLLGNYIGLTADGESALGNNLEGVLVENEATRNTVGAGNVISANLAGVAIVGAGSGFNVVADSFIGTDADGLIDLGNTREGVRIDGSPSNRISGDGQGSQVISGNNVGVAFLGASATGNVLTGSFIGTNVTGKLDISNAQQGVLIQDAPGNTVGGTTADARNVISANHWGVDLVGPAASLNVISGNTIGADVSGVAPLGNEVDGVLLRLGATGNTVGGASVEAGNIISFNRRDGVRVEDDSQADSILTNSIDANAGLGIHLVVPVGPTPPDGPNLFQNAPVLTAVRTSTEFTNLQGTLSSAAGTYVVQFFASAPPAPGYVTQGARYLGETTVEIDSPGTAFFSADVSGIVASGELVTATATSGAGNTSEFSAPLAEVLGTVQFLVASTTWDEGAGQAIITVVRTGGSGGRATVQYATAGGTAQPNVDYTPVSGTLVFDIGVDTQTFSVTILQDALPEADETIGLVLSSAAGAAKLGQPSRATITIVDDDQPGTLGFSQLYYDVREDAGFASVTVTRSPAGAPVTVRYATGGGTAVPGVDYTPVSGVLDFAQGVSSQTFQVPILYNPTSSAEPTVLLTLSDPTGGATIGVPDTATIRILNVAAPGVASVQAIPGARGTSVFVVTFNQPLIGYRAEDLRNYGYSIQVAPPGRQPGTRLDRLVAVRSAIYDSYAYTVTLTTTSPIPFGRRVLVQINQVTDVPTEPVGVAGINGLLIDGNGDGRPGGVFRAVLTIPRAPRTLPPAARRGRH